MLPFSGYLMLQGASQAKNISYKAFDWVEPIFRSLLLDWPKSEQEGNYERRKDWYDFISESFTLTSSDPPRQPDHTFQSVPESFCELRKNF